MRFYCIFCSIHDTHPSVYCQPSLLMFSELVFHHTSTHTTWQTSNACSCFGVRSSVWLSFSPMIVNTSDCHRFPVLSLLSQKKKKSPLFSLADVTAGKPLSSSVSPATYTNGICTVFIFISVTFTHLSFHHVYSRTFQRTQPALVSRLIMPPGSTPHW